MARMRHAVMVAITLDTRVVGLTKFDSTPFGGGIHGTIGLDMMMMMLSRSTAKGSFSFTPGSGPSSLLGFRL